MENLLCLQLQPSCRGTALKLRDKHEDKIHPRAQVGAVTLGMCVQPGGTWTTALPWNMEQELGVSGLTQMGFIQSLLHVK